MNFRLVTRYLVSILNCLACAVVAGVQTQGYLLHKAFDAYGSRKLALTYLVPVGWSAHDSTLWNLKIPASPMSHSMVVSNTEGTTWFSYLNALLFEYRLPWHDNREGRVPPARTSDYLLQDFQGVHPGTQFSVTVRQDVPIPYPSVPKSPGVVAHAYRSVLQVRFMDRGTPTLMRLSCFSYGYTVSTGKTTHRGTWVARHLITLTAPEADFQSGEGIAKVVLLSQREEPSFYQHERDVSAMLKIGGLNMDRKFAQIVGTTRPLTAQEQDALKLRVADRDAACRTFFP